MNLCDIDELKPLLSRHGFTFSKGLGQNFLCDESVPENIAENADIDEDTCVLEVGPGVGALTQELLKRAKSVTAVELDARLFPLLAETVGKSDAFSLVHGDILKVNIKEICAGFSSEKAVACANLPYYITTPAITALLESGCFKTVTVMVQREVAERICAHPGGRDYGAFTLLVNYYAEAEIILNVGRECFIPQPNVDSAVVRMRIREKPPVSCDKAELKRLISAAFSQRRKTLVNCLKQITDKENAQKAIEKCGFLPTVRGEELSLAQYEQLLNNLK